MKKTITVHIANFIFNIEEGAYQLLQNYLVKISSQFSNEEEREEIMQDIEGRIAELFREQLTLQKEVVVEQDVLDMIVIMGSPEEYIVEDDEPFSQSTSEESTDSKASFKGRQIYRDDENAVLGGVCSGLGAYFGIDPVVFRVLFIAFTIMGGSGILIYLILYFAIPEAKTIAEKLRMKGEKIDVSSIKNQFDKVKNEISDEVNKRKIKTTFNRFVNAFVNLFTNFIKVFSKVIGFAFLIAGIVGVLSLVVLFNKELLSLITEQSISISDLLGLLFESNTHKTIAFYSLIAVLLIPVSYFLIKGIQLLFGLKNKFTSIKVAFITLWVLTACMLFVVGVYLVRNLEESSGNIDQIEYLSFNKEEPITVSLKSNSIFSGIIRDDDEIVLNEMVKLTDSLTYFAFPRLVVEPSQTDSLSIKVIRRARGKRESEAIKLAEEINYDYSFKGNNIELSNSFSIKESTKFRGQNIKIIIKVPKGIKIEFGSDIEELISAVRGNHNLKNTTWINRKGRMVNVLK